MPVLVPGFGAIASDQLQHGGNVVGVGLATEFQVEDDRVLTEIIALDLLVLDRQLREVAKDDASRQPSLAVVARGGDSCHGRPPGPFRRLPIVARLCGERLDAVTLRLRQRPEGFFEL